MQQAHLPFNETQRLKALYKLQILDTPADARFDKLTQAVAQALDVPIAAIGFVDKGRVWQKSGIGLPFPKFQESPRDLSFCAHTVLTPDEPFIVEDASQDARFSDNPAVVGPPFVRFYAAFPIKDEAGLPIGSLCVIDHMARRLSVKQIQDLALFVAQAELLIVLHESLLKLGDVAHRDGLTGLGNRSLFHDRLERLAAGGACAVLHVGLDGFKAVNAQHGHRAGDAVLAEAALRLAALARPVDVVARLGGDEFAILMPGPFDSEEPERLAARVVEAMKPAFVPDEGEVACGASVGVALCPQDASDANGLARQAEEALASAKRSGRARHGRPHRATGSRGVPSLSLDAELVRATEGGEFELHWQPIVDLRGNALHGYEAFLRWIPPEFGEVAPERFLPAAERLGLNTAIDRWALREACARAARWDNEARVAVNVSAQWLGRGKLAEAVSAALASSRLTPERLELDITEGLLNRGAEQAGRDMAALKELGVRIALDDFGMGLSSLSYLKDFPFDMVKLHRTFTQDLRTNPRAASVVEAAITLGHALGITVAAEGVEELWHLDFLQKHGCDLAQGYLFGRPSGTPQPLSLSPRSPLVRLAPDLGRRAA